MSTSMFVWFKHHIAKRDVLKLIVVYALEPSCVLVDTSVLGVPGGRDVCIDANSDLFPHFYL